MVLRETSDLPPSRLNSDNSGPPLVVSPEHPTSPWVRQTYTPSPAPASSMGPIRTVLWEISNPQTLWRTHPGVLLCPSHPHSDVPPFPGSTSKRATAQGYSTTPQNPVTSLLECPVDRARRAPGGRTGSRWQPHALHRVASGERETHSGQEGRGGSQGRAASEPHPRGTCRGQNRASQYVSPHICDVVPDTVKGPLQVRLSRGVWSWEDCPG